jgi:hypothetical protein
VKLSNPWHKLAVIADGKAYEIKAIVKTDAEANTFIATHPSISVIDTDEQGNIYLAETVDINITNKR